MADARHHDLARVNVDWGCHLQLAHQRSAQSCADVQAVFAVPHSGYSNCPTVMAGPARSEEHTSELQSLMRSSYAVFCLNKKICLVSTIYSKSRVHAPIYFKLHVHSLHMCFHLPHIQ